MANADIRQLEMDGIVFYPQTDIHGLVNNGGYAIDDEPTEHSTNLVTSDSVYRVKSETLQENREMVDSVILDYAPVEIHGDVTNAADEEDLTSVNVSGSDVLKFKDKVYNQLVYSGMGKKILRKNMINGVNTLTQSMINDENTIYVIQYDFVLGENITVPIGCVLEFDGGSLSNGTIIGQNTVINSEHKEIFGLNMVFDGSFSGSIYDVWCNNIKDSVKLASISDTLILTQDWTFNENRETLPLPSIKGNGYLINCKQTNFLVENKNEVNIKNLCLTSSIYSTKSVHSAFNVFILKGCTNINIDNVSCKQEVASDNSRIHKFIVVLDSNGVSISNISTSGVGISVEVNVENEVTVSDVKINNVYCNNFETCIWADNIIDLEISHISGINTPEQAAWWINEDNGTDKNGKDLLLVDGTNVTISNLYCEGAIERVIYARRLVNAKVFDIVFKNCQGIKFVGTVPANPTYDDINSENIIINNITGFLNENDIYYTRNVNREILILYMVKSVSANNLTIIGTGTSEHDIAISLSRAVKDISINNVNISIKNHEIQQLLSINCTTSGNTIYCDNFVLSNANVRNVGYYSRAKVLIDTNAPIVVDGLTMSYDGSHDIVRRVTSNEDMILLNSKVICCPNNTAALIFPRCTNCVYDLKLRNVSGYYYNTLIIPIVEKKAKYLKNTTICVSESQYLDNFNFVVDGVSDNYIIEGVQKVKGTAIFNNSEFIVPIALLNNRQYVSTKLNALNIPGEIACYKYNINFDLYVPLIASVYNYIIGTDTIKVLKLVANSGQAFSRLYIDAFQISTPSNIEYFARHSGPTSSRPSLVNNGGDIGYPYFDTSLGIPVWSDGSGGWVDSTGATV